MTFRQLIREVRWSCKYKEHYFHKTWIFCLERNFAYVWTDIVAITVHALSHGTINFFTWHLPS